MQKIKVGDTVQVICGDEKGAKGTVRSIKRGWRINRHDQRLGRDASKDKIIIGGVNIVKKHQKSVSQTRTQTGIIDVEAPVPSSNIMLICPNCSQPTRVGISSSEDGTKYRTCKKCGQAIDKVA